jgi:hypothetical protein
MNEWFRKNAGTGAGKLLYEVREKRDERRERGGRERERERERREKEREREREREQERERVRERERNSERTRAKETEKDSEEQLCVDKFDRSTITTTGRIPSTRLRLSPTRPQLINLSRGDIRERLLRWQLVRERKRSGRGEERRGEKRREEKKEKIEPQQREREDSPQQRENARARDRETERTTNRDDEYLHHLFCSAPTTTKPATTAPQTTKAATPGKTHREHIGVMMTDDVISSDNDQGCDNCSSDHKGHYSCSYDNETPYHW